MLITKTNFLLDDVEKKGIILGISFPHCLVYTLSLFERSSYRTAIFNQIRGEKRGAISIMIISNRL